MDPLKKSGQSKVIITYKPHFMGRQKKDRLRYADVREQLRKDAVFYEGWNFGFAPKLNFLSEGPHIKLRNLEIGNSNFKIPLN